MNVHVAPTQSTAPPTAKSWLKALSRYRQPNSRRSLLELGVTLGPFLALWGLALASAHYGFWWGLVLIVPAAGFLLRLFMIQHDCGHGAFFAHRRADDWTGRALGILTLTPYDYWRAAHATHHASAGNLDERGVGDILTLTVAEYRALSRWGRLRYRLYRNPLVMFAIGPVYLFVLKHRWPFETFRVAGMPWRSTMLTNLVIVALGALLIWLTGIVPFLAVHLAIAVLAGAAGIWLFYVQHQFEDTHWSDGSEWTFEESALHGASNYLLPRPLQWLSGNIGIHHVHHLSSRVPFYRLPEVLRDHPELSEIGRITVLDSLRCVKLVLWDERARRLVSFREAMA
ncbi:fatty acid desaturase [Mesorhizobium australicum]|uniref:Omega-6 fatty acid desaturase (Delta-12 desaturase) n=1 Tax=Mesorhizobium australicum TaxID=536018 RepID=A0A1X7NZ70_9HYPH|nr:fatty acid desaturase [Mesorhizobium australicum]SMH43162.1 omega-6 fatty acid desaturase (delta-12 desaturase) [Mesorhizobium australicum]